MEKRSPAMIKVIERLKVVDRSQSWLGKQLVPPVKRQSVSGWTDVPPRYVRQVARLLGMRRRDVRPDLAEVFVSTSPNQRAA